MVSPLPCLILPSSPAPYLGTPYLELLSEEALLNFTSRAVGQASVPGPASLTWGWSRVSGCLWPQPARLLTWLSTYTARAQDSDSGLLPATRPLCHQPILLSRTFLPFYCLTLISGLEQSLPPGSPP